MKNRWKSTFRSLREVGVRPMSNPSKAYFTAVDRVFKFLLLTIEIGLYF
jgi:hypothetical protein